MDKIEAEDNIRQYLLDNYEFILSELLPVIDHRDSLLKTHPQLYKDIRDQFRWSVGSIMVQMVSMHRADIPAEDINIYIRSLNIEHFLTLGLYDRL